MQSKLNATSNPEKLYQPDILGADFEQLTIHQPDDYEGSVTCTLIRKRAKTPRVKAVLHVHGFNDYFFQTEMAEQYLSNGYAFYAIDLRKYGRSYLPHQTFNHARNLKEYFEDIEAALKQMREEGMQNILLSGHSTGGLIIALYAHQHPHSNNFNAIFLNSPFFDFNLHKFIRTYLLPMVGNYGLKNPMRAVPGGFSGFYGLSLHKSGYGEWDYDLRLKPHIAPRIHAGWIRAILQGQKMVKAGLHIDKPVLIMHATKSVYGTRWKADFLKGDVVLNIQDIKKGAEKIKGDVQVVAIEGGLHDLVLSPKKIREQVYHLLFSWLIQKL